MLSPLRGLVALGLLAATLVGLGGASANASHTPDGQPTDGRIVTGESGGEVTGPPGFQFITVFDASSGRSGENPIGTVRVDSVTLLRTHDDRHLQRHLSRGRRPPGDDRRRCRAQTRLRFPPTRSFYVEDCVGGVPDRGAESSTPGRRPARLDLSIRDEDRCQGDRRAPPCTTRSPCHARLRQCFGGAWRSYGFKSLGRCLVFGSSPAFAELQEQSPPASLPAGRSRR